MLDRFLPNLHEVGPDSDDPSNRSTLGTQCPELDCDKLFATCLIADYAGFTVPTGLFKSVS